MGALFYGKLLRSAPVKGLLLLLSGVTTLACHHAPRAQFAGVDSALEHLLAQTECSRAVQGDAQISVEGPFIQPLRAHLLFKAEAPERLRFDIYSSLGVTLNTLTSDGNSFAIYDLAQRTFTYGPANSCNLARFTQVRVPPFALVELLRGRPPVLSHQSSDARLRWSNPLFSRGRYVIHIDGDSGSHEKIVISVPREDWDLPLRQQRLRLQSVRVEQNGSLLYEVELDDYQEASSAKIERSAEEIEMGVPAPLATGPACSAPLPRSVRFNVGRGGYKLSIESKEIHHNPAQAPHSYTQDAPNGVVSQYSACE